jgi:DNA-directed RNA polymerase subunit H (RpoH/RPB5)
MEERALDQLRVILERQGVKSERIESQENTEKYLSVKIGDRKVILSRKQKIVEKDIAAWLETDAPFVLITQTKPSQNIEQAIRTYLAKGSIQLYFHLRELQFDVTQHRMFPPHFLFNDTFKKAHPEIVEKFERFRMKNPEEELPRIDCMDIGARLVGAKSGEIVYIQRYSDTGGYVPYWRRVVTDANVDQ